MHCAERRTMEMPLAINKYSPFRKWWDPKLVFTGVSIMGVNMQNGAVRRPTQLGYLNQCARLLIRA